MPHKADFSKITNVKSAMVHPKGWIDPITVEYGIGMHYNTPSYFWRVKGTQHAFVIPISRFEFLSSGEYDKHFKEALEGFREDYLEWKTSEFEQPWMREYREEFGRFILV